MLSCYNICEISKTFLHQFLFGLISSYTYKHTKHTINALKAHAGIDAILRSAPVIHGSAPVILRSAPVIHESAPVILGPAPVILRSTPIILGSAHVPVGWV